MQHSADTSSIPILQAALSSLQAGLHHVPLAEGLEMIEHWRDRLTDRADNPRTREVAGRLSELRKVLVEGDGRSEPIGTCVARLGSSVLAAAGEATDPDAARLTERIGHYLFHAGHALRGAGPSDTSPTAPLDE